MVELTTVSVLVLELFFPMKLSFYGAARSVTGSMHLVESSGKRILLDCGLYQGHRALAFERNAHLPFDPKTVDTAILSHAHIDHCGNFPTLVKNGFQGQVQCTNATRDLAALMLRDSAHIQEQDADYMNQKNSRRGLPPVKPLYTAQDAENVMPRLTGHAYDSWFNIGDRADGRVQFLDAGHILGSAITVLELNDQGRALRVGFTGDLGRCRTSLLRDPASARGLDYLIIESTYGNRDHPPIQEAQTDLARIVLETIARRGKVVIPAFAVERTQEVVYALHEQNHAGTLRNTPAFVDSPLAIDATNVFRMHLECLRQEIREHLISHDDPFGFERLRYTRDVEESKKINAVQGAAIIISANGMCEAGRVLHHLKNNIEDERNTILFVGYQAESTLGRRIVDGVKKVKIFGDEYTVRAHIEVADGFSAHADRTELSQWVQGARENLKGIYVVHGEENAALAFADQLRGIGNFPVTVPEPNQTIEI